MRVLLFLILAAFGVVVSASCNADNCLRALRAASANGAAFCSSYTASSYSSSFLPAFVSPCSATPSRISSACSCLITSSTTTSSSVSSSSTTTSSSSTTSAPSGPSSCSVITTVSVSTVFVTLPPVIVTVTQSTTEVVTNPGTVSTETDTVVSIDTLPASTETDTSISIEALTGLTSTITETDTVVSTDTLPPTTSTITETDTTVSTTTTTTTTTITTTNICPSASACVCFPNPDKAGDSCGCEYTLECSMAFAAGTSTFAAPVRSNHVFYHATTNFECSAFMYDESSGLCAQTTSIASLVSAPGYDSGIVASGSCTGDCSESYS